MNSACQASLSFAISQSLLKLVSIELVMPFNHLILLLLLPPSIFPTIRVFFNELALRIRWPKYWSFSFSITSEWFSPSLNIQSFQWISLDLKMIKKKKRIQERARKVNLHFTERYFFVPDRKSAGQRPQFRPITVINLNMASKNTGLLWGSIFSSVIWMACITWSMRSLDAYNFEHHSFLFLISANTS